VSHFTSSRFWERYNQLPAEIREQADKQFELLKRNPAHPSLRFKKIGRYWSARVNVGIRALAVESGADLVWFWIGAHREYERMIKKG
jgi:hypothetical protein